MIFLQQRKSIFHYSTYIALVTFNISNSLKENIYIFSIFYETKNIFKNIFVDH